MKNCNTIPKTLNKLSFVFLFPCILMYLSSCTLYNKNYDWAENIQKGNYKIVSLGTYPYTTSQIRYEAQEFIKLRKEIEKSNELLSKIVHHFYPEEENAGDKSPRYNFKYKFAATDSFGNKIILRYFAMKVPIDEFAGYSIQFIFIDEKVHEAYLFKTPLE